MSRLCRLLIVDGLHKIVIPLITADCAIVFISYDRIYTREILNNDPGAIHTLGADLHAANVDARDKTRYSKFGYAKRRGKPRATCPGWLTYHNEGDREWYEIIEWTVVILVRIFFEVEDYSASRIAAR